MEHLMNLLWVLGKIRAWSNVGVSCRNRLEWWRSEVGRSLESYEGIYNLEESNQMDIWKLQMDNKNRMEGKIQKPKRIDHGK